MPVLAAALRNDGVAPIAAGAPGIERPAGDEREARRAVLGRDPEVTTIDHLCV